MNRQTQIAAGPEQSPAEAEPSALRQFVRDVVRLVCLGLLIPACTALSDGMNTSGDVANELAVQADCTAAVEAFPSIPAGFTEVTDGLAFVTPEGNFQLGRTGTESDPTSMLTFSKIPVAVRTDSNIALFVHPDSQSSTLIAWGTVGRDPVHGIAFEPCKGTEAETSWMVFPGGVWVTDPACVGLVALADGAVTYVELPVAQQCPESGLSTS